MHEGSNEGAQKDEPNGPPQVGWFQLLASHSDFRDRGSSEILSNPYTGPPFSPSRISFSQPSKPEIG